MDWILFTWTLVKTFASAWAIAAYVVAAVAGLRVLHLAHGGIPAAPICLIADATRWVLGRPRHGLEFRPRDFIVFGISGTVIASLVACIAASEVLVEAAGTKFYYMLSFKRAAADILTGSALIVLHCGVALRLEGELANG